MPRKKIKWFENLADPDGVLKMALQKRDAREIVAKIRADGIAEEFDTNLRGWSTRFGILRKEQSKVTQLAAVAKSEAVKQVLEEVHESLDVLAEMERLYGIQMDRIKQGLAMEARFKVLNKNMTSEIKEAHAILKTMHSVKKDITGTGDLGKALEQRPEIGPFAEGQYGNRVVEAIENAESRHRIFQAANKLFALANARASVEVIEVNADDEDSQAQGES